MSTNGGGPEIGWTRSCGASQSRLSSSYVQGTGKPSKGPSRGWASQGRGEPGLILAVSEGGHRSSGALEPRISQEDSDLSMTNSSQRTPCFFASKVWETFPTNIFFCSLQAEIMHLTDSAVRHQLFLDVLDGTKALVSVSGRFHIPPLEKSKSSSRTCSCISGQVKGLSWPARPEAAVRRQRPAAAMPAPGPFSLSHP